MDDKRHMWIGVLTAAVIVAIFIVIVILRVYQHKSPLPPLDVNRPAPTATNEPQPSMFGAICVDGSRWWGQAP